MTIAAEVRALDVRFLPKPGARGVGAKLDLVSVDVRLTCRKGDVGPLQPGGVLDAVEQVGERVVGDREWCRRCGTGLNNGRELKGCLGCPALGQHPNDEPQCARFLFERAQAALEVRDPLIVRLWHALSVSWAETKARVGEALQ